MAPVRRRLGQAALGAGLTGVVLVDPEPLWVVGVLFVLVARVDALEGAGGRVVAYRPTP